MDDLVARVRSELVGICGFLNTGKAWAADNQAHRRAQQGKKYVGILRGGDWGAGAQSSRTRAVNKYTQYMRCVITGLSKPEKTDRCENIGVRLCDYMRFNCWRGIVEIEETK